MIELSDHIERMKFIMQLHKDVDAGCVKEFAEDTRTHLGASIIGHDCQAYAWNTFRWLKQEAFKGQQLRLFNRGHEEEHRFIRWLRAAGFTVYETDSAGNQFRIVGCGGHFGGSLDCVAFRDDIGNVLGEFKTHNEKSFKKLQKDGLVKSKPQHYKQMCSYGRANDLHYGLYCAVNKNTDELYFELVPLDFKQADDLFRKADGIIRSQTQPPKIAQVATYFECVYCDFKGICHSGETPDKNCRSCRLCMPVDDAKWKCQLHNAIIPPEFIPQGCDSWARII